MSPTQIQEAILHVRGQLKELEDGPGADPSTSIERCASESLIDADTLREFRDGRDDALDISLVVKWSRLLDPIGFAMGMVEDPVDPRMDIDNAENERVRRLEMYDTMEVRGEYASALTCWADMAIAGAIGQSDAYGFVPQAVNESDTELLRAVYRHVQKILPPAELHTAVRSMVKWGNDFEQIVIGQSDRGRYEIASLDPMPIRRTRYARNPTSDRAFVLLRSETDSIDSKDAIEFPSWKVVDFSNRMDRQEKYGRSVGHSGTRSFMQIEALEESAMIRRMDRASMRYKFDVAVSGISDPEKQREQVRRWEEHYRKTRTIDTSSNLRRQRIGRPPDRDVFIPKTGNKADFDVSVMQGDANLNDMNDLLHFFNKWLASLGPSKLMLGYEGDTTRSVGSETTIVFARKCRQVQQRVIRALNHIYTVEMVLRGRDPRTVPYVIYPPSLGTRDELVRAQIQLSYASAIRQLSTAFAMTGEVPSVEWYLRNFMQLDEDTISELDLKPIVKDVSRGAQKPRGGDKASPPAEVGAMLNKIATDRTAMSDMQLLRHMIDERRMSRMSPKVAYESGLYASDQYAPNFNPGEFASRIGLLLQS